MLRRISQPEKDKYLCYHLYVESKKIKQQTYVTKQKQTQYIENKLAVTSGEREGRRGKIRVGD